MGLAVVIASCSPFVHQQTLPLFAYSRVLLVPIGGIVLAEHYLFPRLDYTRYWYRFKGLKHHVPALAAWAISFVVGFSLDILGVLPYVYIFLPTWAVSIILYVLLAKQYGATEKYPEQEEAERQFQARVAEWQAKQAEMEGMVHVNDTSVRSRVIKLVWILIGLALPSVLAWITLLHSPDLYDYYVNVERFYSITIWCTLVYFTFAYWGLKRAKGLQRSGTPATAESTA